MTNRVLFSYSGVVLPAYVTGLIGALSSALSNQGVAQPHYLKIIRISIEALQNQARHGKWTAFTTSADTSTFIVYEKDDSYTITTRNLICTPNIPDLEKKLHSINADTEIDLMHRFRMQIKNTRQLNTKGAGLGLMDMRRKSGTSLTFTFQECTSIHSFFQLSITLFRVRPN